MSRSFEKVVGLGVSSVRKSYFREFTKMKKGVSLFHSLCDMADVGLILCDYSHDDKCVNIIYSNVLARRLLALPSDSARICLLKVVTDSINENIQSFLEGTSHSVEFSSFLSLAKIPCVFKLERVTEPLSPFSKNSESILLQVKENLEAPTDRSESVQLKKTAANGVYFESIVNAVNETCGKLMHSIESISAESELLSALYLTEKSTFERIEKIEALCSTAKSHIRKVQEALFKEEYADRVQIGDVLTESMEILRVTVPANIQLQLDVRDRRAVLSDKVSLLTILFNLVTNAIESMPMGGSLLVSVDSPLASATNVLRAVPDLELRDFVLLTVSDTGCGISPKVGQRIFDSDFTTKVNSFGAGLGLHVVKTHVEELGGRIFFESTLGKGSVFSVLLYAE